MTGIRLVRELVTLERSDPGASVLVVTNLWPHEGQQQYGIFVKRQVESLVALGLRCDVLFVRGFRSPLAYAVAALKLLRLSLARRPRYRLVHAHGGETLIPSLFFLRAPLLVSFCGDDLLGTPDEAGRISRASRAKSAVLRQLARLAAATITKSREMEGALPPRLRRRNHVLPNGVDRKLFRPHDRAAARKELGWRERGRVALFVGDPGVPRKRHALALAACDRAATRGCPVELEVAQSTPTEAMPTLLSAADCLLMTSAIEGSPNAVKEALMCDLPVVATPAGDVAELLAGVDPSYVCEPRPDDLAEALIACMRNGGRSNGRERSAWLDQRRIGARLLGIYTSLGLNVPRTDG